MRRRKLIMRVRSGELSKNSGEEKVNVENKFGTNDFSPSHVCDEPVATTTRDTT